VLLLVSAVTILSGVAILWPTEPCAGIRAVFASSCTTGGLNMVYVVWGAIAVLVGIGGIIRVWPADPIRGTR
jgi:hypothetical protein